MTPIWDLEVENDGYDGSWGDDCDSVMHTSADFDDCNDDTDIETIAERMF